MLLTWPKFNRLHDILPLLFIYLQGKGFFGAALDCCLSRGHFISSQACYDPLQAFMRQHSNFKAYELNFVRICKISDCLVDYSITFSHFDEVFAFLIRKLELLLHLRYKAISQHKQFPTLSKIKEKDLNLLHFGIVCLLCTFMVRAWRLLRNLKDWLLDRHMLRP